MVGLGIRHVGDETARLLAQEFGTLDCIIAASADELVGVEGIGEVVGQSIADYFADDHHLELIEQFRNNGVSILPVEPRAKGALSGKSFVLTGTLALISREEAKEKIRALGGDPSESVSKKPATWSSVKTPAPSSTKPKTRRLRFDGEGIFGYDQTVIYGTKPC